MATEENPFEAVRVMMLENLEKVGGATQTYIDMVEKTMPGFPGANEEQIGTFKATSSGKLQPTETSGRSFCNPGIFGRSSAFRSNTSFSLDRVRCSPRSSTRLSARKQDHSPLRNSNGATHRPLTAAPPRQRAPF